MYYLIFSCFLALVFGAVSFRRYSKKSCLYLTIAVALFWFVVNYCWALPVLTPWYFHAPWVEFFFTSVMGLGVYYASRSIESDYLGYGQDGMLYDSVVIGKYELKHKFLLCCRWMPLGISIIAFIAMALMTMPIFHSSTYQKMLSVEVVSDSVFKHDISPVPVEKMRVGDDSLAMKFASDKLGEHSGLGSRCEIGDMTLQMLSGEFTVDNGVKLKFDNDLVWVAPLEHSSFWKWLANGITPGYVLVDAADLTRRYLVTNLNGKPLSIKYAKQCYWATDLERHIRVNGYINKGLSELNFEIDNHGNPYWVVPVYQPTVGFSGYNIVEVLTVDAQNGDIKSYPASKIPDWIDRIQPQKIVDTQINDWGIYVNGWKNSWWSKYDVKVATPGMSLVQSEGRSYWYTGIQSSGRDNGTNGFMLVDTKTKTAKYYQVSETTEVGNVYSFSGGFNESEARKIAQDSPFASAAKYSADWPVLYNVRNVPTYFMTMKGKSGNIVGYCFLAVSNRQALGCGTTKKEAEQAYLEKLRRLTQDIVKDGYVSKQVKDYVVKAITCEGRIYYLLFENMHGKEFYASSEFFPELKWTKAGDKVKVEYGDSPSLSVPLDYFDNVDFSY